MGLGMYNSSLHERTAFERGLDSFQVNKLALLQLHDEAHAAQKTNGPVWVQLHQVAGVIVALIVREFPHAPPFTVHIAGCDARAA